MRRKEFLKDFLGALGAKDIKWHEESDSSISGTVTYEIDDPEEIQDFIWHIRESEVPSEEVKALARLINEKNLLSIDKIRVSRSDLRNLYSNSQGRIVPEHDFLQALEALKSIEVSMVDNGKETDIFFIHE